MRNLTIAAAVSVLIGTAGLLSASASLAAQAAMPAMPNMAMPAPASNKPVLVPDPTKVVMIVNRDSNEIAFMDIATKKIVGKTFLGNNVNPHMVMMSPDGRYVVTGGQRSSMAYIIDARTLELVKKIPSVFSPSIWRSRRTAATIIKAIRKAIPSALSTCSR
jgi:hypothetical protein